MKLYFYLLFLGIVIFACKKKTEIKPAEIITKSEQPIVIPAKSPVNEDTVYVPVNEPEEVIEFSKFSAEAHRGGRGVMPENTIIAMLNASKLSNVTTLEMDTYITKDGKVVVTHDDYLNPLLMLTSDGKEIPLENSKKYPIFKMDYSDIKKFDIGTKILKDFPSQKKIKTYIPLLADLIDSVQNDIKSRNRKQLFYNIETKSTISGDNIVNPVPEVFVKLLMDVIEQKNISKYVVLESFDKRTLQIINKKYPLIKTSFIVSNRKTYEENIADLGFTPFILSPSADMVNSRLVTSAHLNGVKIITWTVNSAAEIKRLKDLDVDGVITDYPSLL
jgi:glycerophosphoryl diester phosphodiesterase